DDAIHELAFVGQQTLEVVGLLPELAVLGFELLALEAGEATEAHVENRLGLPCREVDEASLANGVDLFFGATGALEEALETEHLLEDELGLGLIGVLRVADDLDDPVDLHRRKAQAFDDFSTLAGDAQVVQRAAGDHLAPVLDKDLETVAQAQ